RDKYIAGPVAGCAAIARQAHGGAACEPLQLLRQERSISGYHDNNRAVVLFADGLILDLLAHRNSGDAKLGTAAAVALHQHTQGVASRISVELARGGPDAAFETKADHSGPA